ncbi:preprotein translocase subunit YajC [Bacteroidia bacterium]|nr:preprotein translocase subunit YajC [Bacteroidia bacterium]GHU79350.1 preprotein translocase subunit YajC [Bacteroidia bacterium]
MTSNLLYVLLQAAAPQSGGWEKFSMPLMLVAVFAIMYFMMIRPQQKRQKEIQKMRESIKVGDKVVTAGGIHGKIKEVNNSDFLVEIADNIRIRVDKASVFASSDDAQASK